MDETYTINFAATKTKKVVLNSLQNGRFYISDDAVNLFIHYRVLAGINHPENFYFPDDLHRDDPILIRVVEELGRGADGYKSRLTIVEFKCRDQDGWGFEIDNYCGLEYIVEYFITPDGKYKCTMSDM